MKSRISGISRLFCKTKLDTNQISKFRENGFLVVEDVLDDSFVKQLRKVVEPLFDGEFETGVYPDEWHWRKGVSLPNKTKEIVNAWKSDRTIAGLALSQTLGKLCAQLLDWKEGSRIAQDDVIIKPPGGSAVGYHQDSSYISRQFEPLKDNSVTCWFPLDDVSAETGSIEYIKGSHKWPHRETPGEQTFFEPPEWDQAVSHGPVGVAARESGIQTVPEPSVVELKAGGVAFHHQNMWHGSGPNLSNILSRRAVVVHLMRADVNFRRDRKIDYIYGRYCRYGDLAVDESFFPIIWTPNGYRSPIISELLLEPQITGKYLV
eukprot:207965_1